MIYLASPYAHPVHAVRAARYQAVLAETVRLINLDYTVFAPVVYGHPLAMNGTVPPRGWLTFDYAMLAACDDFWVLKLPGWEASDGIRQEIKWAQERKTSIRYVAPGTVLRGSA